MTNGLAKPRVLIHCAVEYQEDAGTEEAAAAKAESPGGCDCGKAMVTVHTRSLVFIEMYGIGGRTKLHICLGELKAQSPASQREQLVHIYTFSLTGVK